MARIGYVCIGTNDFDRATAFYDALFAELDGKRLMPTPAGLMYRVGKGAMVMLTRPHDKQAASVSNGGMLAIEVDSKEQVAAMHAKALALGGKCEGEPGPRGNFGDFAYFRDLDGNKLAVYFTARAAS
jgi:catechol 2,3-dioxygenase-like lactoylglutathione lyase family enzyme